MGRVFAELRPLDRLEIDQNQFPVERVAEAPEDSVSPVPRVSVNEDLASEQFLAALLHLDVDVRGRTSRVRHGLDGAEVILARRAGQKAAEALEVPVLLVLLGAAVVGVEVHGLRVALPDL